MIHKACSVHPSEEVTGKEEDKEYAHVYVRDSLCDFVIDSMRDMEIEVKDWQKFLSEIDLEKINEERKEAGPFAAFLVTKLVSFFSGIAGKE